MALNYSHRPVSPTHISEVLPTRVVNGYLVEGVFENNGEVYSRTWHVNQIDADECNFTCGRDRVDCCISPEPISNDIVDLLPFDPFGMDTFATVSGWLRDYGDWNLIWNNSFTRCFQIDQKLNAAHSLSTYEEEAGNEAVMCGLLAYGSGSCSFQLGCTGQVEGSEFEGAPHEAFNYVFSYLSVKDLLTVERVCSSLSTDVRGDPLLWKTIHIDEPLNERINDDVLVQLAGRAQGKLECLNLVKCPKVTDDGLKRVFEANRRLTKLCVPGCTRISIECIINCIRSYNGNNEFGGIKQVRIGGLFGVNHENFEELNSLLGSREEKIKRHHKSHFYYRGNFYLPFNDGRTIDIEKCPRCEKFRLVYDCPFEGCKGKDMSPQLCRACILCVGRCAQCGRCSNGTEFEETFSLESLCSGCFEQPHNYEDKLDMKVDSLELNLV